MFRLPECISDWRMEWFSKGHVYSFFRGVTFFFFGKHPDIFFEKNEVIFQNYQFFFVFLGGFYRFTTKAIVPCFRNSFQGENTKHFQKSHSLVFGFPKHPCIHRAAFGSFGPKERDPGGPSVSIELNYYQQKPAQNSHFLWTRQKNMEMKKQNRFEFA